MMAGMTLDEARDLCVVLFLETLSSLSIAPRLRKAIRRSGNSLEMFLFFSCTDLNSVGRRQNAFLSSCVGYLSTMSGRGEYSGSRCSGMASGKFHTTARALAFPKGWQP